MKKSKILKRRKKLLEILKSIIFFNILAIPMYLVIYSNFSLPELQIFLSSCIANTLKALGYPVTQTGYFLWMGFPSEKEIILQKFEITFDCTGWKSMYALAALAIATPKIDKKKKIKFIAIALPLIFFVNFLRITTTLIFTYHLGYEYLSVVHNFLWREGLIFAILIIWFLWLKKENII